MPTKTTLDKILCFAGKKVTAEFKPALSRRARLSEAKKNLITLKPPNLRESTVQKTIDKLWNRQRWKTNLSYLKIENAQVLILRNQELNKYTLIFHEDDTHCGAPVYLYLNKRRRKCRIRRYKFGAQHTKVKYFLKLRKTVQTKSLPMNSYMKKMFWNKLNLKKVLLKGTKHDDSNSVALFYEIDRNNLKMETVLYAQLKTKKDVDNFVVAIKETIPDLCTETEKSVNNANIDTNSIRAIIQITSAHKSIYVRHSMVAKQLRKASINIIYASLNVRDAPFINTSLIGFKLHSIVFNKEDQDKRVREVLNKFGTTTIDNVCSSDNFLMHMRGYFNMGGFYIKKNATIKDICSTPELRRNYRMLENFRKRIIECSLMTCQRIKSFNSIVDEMSENRFRMKVLTSGVELETCLEEADSPDDSGGITSSDNSKSESSQTLAIPMARSLEQSFIEVNTGITTTDFGSMIEMEQKVHNSSSCVEVRRGVKELTAMFSKGALCLPTKKPPSTSNLKPCVETHDSSRDDSRDDSRYDSRDDSRDDSPDDSRKEVDADALESYAERLVRMMEEGNIMKQKQKAEKKKKTSSAMPTPEIISRATSPSRKAKKFLKKVHKSQSVDTKLCHRTSEMKTKSECKYRVETKLKDSSSKHMIKMMLKKDNPSKPRTKPTKSDKRFQGKTASGKNINKKEFVELVQNKILPSKNKKDLQILTSVLKEEKAKRNMMKYQQGNMHSDSQTQTALPEKKDASKKTLKSTTKTTKHAQQEKNTKDLVPLLDFQQQTEPRNDNIEESVQIKMTDVMSDYNIDSVKREVIEKLQGTWQMVKKTLVTNDGNLISCKNDIKSAPQNIPQPIVTYDPTQHPKPLIVNCAPPRQHKPFIDYDPSKAIMPEFSRPSSPARSERKSRNNPPNNFGKTLIEELLNPPKLSEWDSSSYNLISTSVSSKVTQSLSDDSTACKNNMTSVSRTYNMPSHHFNDSIYEKVLNNKKVVIQSIKTSLSIIKKLNETTRLMRENNLVGNNKANGTPDSMQNRENRHDNVVTSKGDISREKPDINLSNTDVSSNNKNRLKRIYGLGRTPQLKDMSFLNDSFLSRPVETNFVVKAPMVEECKIREEPEKPENSIPNSNRPENKSGTPKIRSRSHDKKITEEKKIEDKKPGVEQKKPVEDNKKPAIKIETSPKGSRKVNMDSIPIPLKKKEEEVKVKMGSPTSRKAEEIVDKFLKSNAPLVETSHPHKPAPRKPFIASVIATNNLSDLSLANVAPIKAEYPRRDTFTSMPIENTYLYKLVELGKMEPDMESSILCADKNCAKCHAMRPKIKKKFNFKRYHMDYGVPRNSSVISYPVNVKFNVNNDKLKPMTSDTKSKSPRTSKSPEPTLRATAIKNMGKHSQIILPKKPIKKIESRLLDSRLQKRFGLGVTNSALRKTVDGKDDDDRGKSGHKKYRDNSEPPVSGKRERDRDLDTTKIDKKELGVKKKNANFPVPEKTTKKAEIQKYIEVVEDRFIKTLSLSEKEKLVAFNLLAFEIRQVLDALGRGNDKVTTKLRINESLSRIEKTSTIENSKQQTVKNKNVSPLRHLIAQNAIASLEKSPYFALLTDNNNADCQSSRSAQTLNPPTIISTNQTTNTSFLSEGSTDDQLPKLKNTAENEKQASEPEQDDKDIEVIYEDKASKNSGRAACNTSSSAIQFCAGCNIEEQQIKCYSNQTSENTTRGDIDKSSVWLKNIEINKFKYKTQSIDDAHWMMSHNKQSRDCESNNNNSNIESRDLFGSSRDNTNNNNNSGDSESGRDTSNNTTHSRDSGSSRDANNSSGNSSSSRNNGNKSRDSESSRGTTTNQSRDSGSSRGTTTNQSRDSGSSRGTTTQSSSSRGTSSEQTTDSAISGTSKIIKIAVSPKMSSAKLAVEPEPSNLGISPVASYFSCSTTLEDSREQVYKGLTLRKSTSMNSESSTETTPAVPLHDMRFQIPEHPDADSRPFMRMMSSMFTSKSTSHISEEQPRMKITTDTISITQTSVNIIDELISDLSIKESNILYMTKPYSSLFKDMTTQTSGSSISTCSTPYQSLHSRDSALTRETDNSTSFLSTRSKATLAKDSKITITPCLESTASLLNSCLDLIKEKGESKTSISLSSDEEYETLWEETASDSSVHLDDRCTMFYLKHRVHEAWSMHIPQVHYQSHSYEKLSVDTCSIPAIDTFLDVLHLDDENKQQSEKIVSDTPRTVLEFLDVLTTFSLEPLLEKKKLRHHKLFCHISRREYWPYIYTYYKVYSQTLFKKKREEIKALCHNRNNDLNFLMQKFLRDPELSRTLERNPILTRFISLPNFRRIFNDDVVYQRHSMKSLDITVPYENLKSTVIVNFQVMNPESPQRKRKRRRSVPRSKLVKSSAKKFTYELNLSAQLERFHRKLLIRFYFLYFSLIFILMIINFKCQ